MIKFSATEIWSKIPLEIKNKPRLALFSAEYKKYDYSPTRNIICARFIGIHKAGALINYLTLL